MQNSAAVSQKEMELITMRLEIPLLNYTQTDYKLRLQAMLHTRVHANAVFTTV